MNIDFLPVSWEEYHTLSQKLAATILSHDQKYDEIVAISRGGLTFGHLLSDLLHLPICTFTIQSYSDIKVNGETRITEPLSKPIAGKNILLVDDVSDSGTTLIRAISYLNKFKPISITTVTMFYKPSSKLRPDFFAKQTSSWVIYPYEITETIISITQMMDSEGKSKAEIQKLLTNLHFLPDQISFVRKYYLK